MGFLRRLFAPGPPLRDRAPGVWVVQSMLTGKWNPAQPHGMGRQEARAREDGRMDGASGTYGPYSHAHEPAAITSIKARLAQNRAALVAEKTGALGQMLARAERRDMARETCEANADQAASRLARARARLSELPASRFGFADVPRSVVSVVASLLVIADVLFTQLALVESLGNLPEWEAWAIAATMGALLFACGAGKAYIEAEHDRAREAGEDGLFGARSARRLGRFVFWMTAVMLLGLGCARVSLVDWQSETLVEWVGALGALLAVTMAAVLVAVVAYLGGRIIFGAQPRAAARSELRRASRAHDVAQRRLSAATQAASEARSDAACLDARFEQAILMAEEAWTAVAAAYWRGFALACPEQQPAIEPLGARSNGHRDFPAPVVLR